MASRDLVCWELVSADSCDISAVRDLYETYLDEDERIPWAWIERGLERRQKWEPGKPKLPHLIAGAVRPATHPQGFIQGLYLSGVGGYAGYMAVHPSVRGAGLGSGLFLHLIEQFKADAERDGQPLPLVLWESHKPGPAASPAERDNWHARVKTFAKSGALWVRGADFRAPNYMKDDGPDVELQLFVAPADVPASALGDRELRRLVVDLYTRVYKGSEDDERLTTMLANAQPLSLASPLDLMASPRLARC